MKKADFSYSGFEAKSTLWRSMLWVSTVVVLLSSLVVWAHDTRAYSSVSPGIERLDDPVSYPVADHNNAGTISKVYVDVSYAGNAKVHTELCHASGSPCIQVGSSTGRQSDAFAGLAAAVGFRLVHTVQNWGSSPRPLFIQSNLSIWTE